MQSGPVVLLVLTDVLWVRWDSSHRTWKESDFEMKNSALKMLIEFFLMRMSLYYNVKLQAGVLLYQRSL